MIIPPGYALAHFNYEGEDCKGCFYNTQPERCPILDEQGECHSHFTLVALTPDQIVAFSREFTDGNK